MKRAQRQQISFRQPAFREFLANGDNDVIQDPNEVKMEIFVTICNILCDRDFAGAGSRRILQPYAVDTFMKHLRDIDIKDIDVKHKDGQNRKAKQGQDVVEALSRVLRNDNDVCLVYERVINQKDPYLPASVKFDLYDPRQSPWIEEDGSPDVIALWAYWAKKMKLHGALELSRQTQS